MTFYEAAVEVLRSAGRPLHVKKITELSVGQNLLTHVGREPEKTMAARLAQEIAKATGESLVRIVRPNVYELRDGADPSDARQTVQLRTFEEEVADESTADAVNVQTDDDSHDNEDDDQDENGRRRSRRRSRRGRSDQTSDDHAAVAREPRNDREPRAERETPAGKPRDNQRDAAPAARAPRRQDDAPARTREEAPTREAEAPRCAPSRPTVRSVSDNASPAAQKLAALRLQAAAPKVDAAGDIGTHIRGILQNAPRGMSLEAIGDALADTAYAAIPQLPTAALRSSLILANARRAAEGQAPLFKECTEGRWSLIEDEASLSQSFEALAQWQAQHQAQLVVRLERVLAGRDDEQILGIVALVMERLGYVGLEIHPAEGDELATFSARLARGLSEERVAVRVFAPDHPATRLDVMAFRGNLHQYSAARGVMFTLGGHSLCAREQTEVPNLAPIDLLHDGQLAELMIRTSVGTTQLEVSISSLDHAFFA